MNLLGASISRRRLVIRRSGGMRHLLMRNSIHLTLFRVSISPYLHLTCCMSHATHVNTGGGEIKQMVDLCAVIIYTSKLLQKYLIHKSFHEYFPRGCPFIYNYNYFNFIYAWSWPRGDSPPRSRARCTGRRPPGPIRAGYEVTWPALDQWELTMA